MQTANDILTVGGNATFNGGSTTGLLTAGIINIAGNFDEAASPLTNFAPSGTHKVVFNGTAPQTIKFQFSGTTDSHFQNVEFNNVAGVSLLSNVFANGQIIVGTAVNQSISGTGQVFTAGGANIDGAVFDNVLLTLTGAPTLFDNVTFQNYAATATPLQLNFNNATGTTALTFNNLNYNTVLSSGFNIGGTGTGNTITVASGNVPGTTATAFNAANTVSWPTTFLTLSHNVPGVPTNGTIDITGHLVDAAGVALANQPLQFSIPVASSAIFSANTLQTVTINTNAAGDATVTFTDAVTEAVTVSATATNFALTQSITQNFASNTGLGQVISTANGNTAPCNVTWGISGSPYFVKNSVTVASGCSLTIDPYVIVKFEFIQNLNISGTLNVNGQAGAPVTFTSIYDDSIGGDTNGDGNATSPGLNVAFFGGDWFGVHYNSGSLGSMSFSHVNYADMAVTLDSASPTLNDLTATEYGVFGLHLLSAAGVASPVVNNLVLHTTFTNSTQLFIESSATGTVAPTITGGTITPTSSFADTAIKISGTGTNPTISNMTVHSDGFCLSTLSGAGVTLKNSVLENALQDSISIGTASGVITLSGNNIVNSGKSGIKLLGAAAGSVIEHNLIRGNSSGGIFVDPLQTVAIPIRNNLIIENSVATATSAAGVHIGAGAAVTLQHNTIANNKASVTGGIGGILIDQTATVTMNDNIFAQNLNAAGLASDASVNALATVTESNNLAMDGSLVGVGDLAVNPLFVKNWYLSNNAIEGIQSGAVDPVGGTTVLPAYLSALTTPTTRTDGITDASAADNVDMGYHHATAAAIVSATPTTVSPTVVTAAVGTTVTITLTPKDAAATALGAGLKIAASLGATASGATVTAIRDLGDGNYEVDVSGGAAGNGDILALTVNGLAITQTVSITW